MSRLAKRVATLEGGQDREDLDIVARVPDCWTEERMSAEVEALAREHGHEPPFGLVVMVARGSEESGAELLCVKGKYLN